MSSFSEQGSIDPDNPKLDYAPLPLSERAAKLGPLVSQGASEPVRPSPILRPVLVPKAIDEPARRTRNLDRRPRCYALPLRSPASSRSRRCSS